MQKKKLKRFKLVLKHKKNQDRNGKVPNNNIISQHILNNKSCMLNKNKFSNNDIPIDESKHNNVSLVDLTNHDKDEERIDEENKIYQIIMRYNLRNGHNKYQICNDKRLYYTYNTKLEAYKEASRLRKIKNSRLLRSELKKKKSHALFIQCKIIGITNTAKGMKYQIDAFIKKTKAYHKNKDKEQKEKLFSLYKL